ncbi:MAG TPA: hypothetical protein PKW49_10230, partial [Paludibacteraceae bacterium]|nr:hypothetical protein [Paludibacteraceae bacterium]HQF50702.1 hypothetical protein [Paludibacteraceae bacterium]
RKMKVGGNDYIIFLLLDLQTSPIGRVSFQLTSLNVKSSFVWLFLSPMLVGDKFHIAYGCAR